MVNLFHGIGMRKRKLAACVPMHADPRLGDALGCYQGGPHLELE